jgi:hypothetical protein
MGKYWWRLQGSLSRNRIGYTEKGRLVAHHLVFVENELAKNEPKEVLFKRIGLEDHTAGAVGLPVSADESPSGNAGTLFAWTSKGDDQIIVKKDQQEWMKSCDGYWVGVWKDNLPTEERLRRPYMQKGIWITFRSGDRWKLPTASSIDQELALKDDGKWEFKPLRELSWYSEEVEKRRSSFTFGEVEDGQVQINLSYDPREAIELIIRALRINYRILPEVAAMMRLMTTRNVSEAYGAMFDISFDE